MFDFRITFFLEQDFYAYIDTAPSEYEAIRQTLGYIPVSSQPLFHNFSIEKLEKNNEK